MAEKKRSASSHRSLTLSDVARKAGVSPTAVSFVLNENGGRNRHVSEETRAKVLQAIQELNFHPHTLARALGKGQSEEIVSISDSVPTLFAVEMTNLFQQRALQYGYIPVIYSSRGLSADQRRDFYHMIFARRPLAIIASPITFTAENVAQARQMGVKHIIFLSFHPEPIEQTHSVVFPSSALGYLAAQHLLERGHRHLALVRPDDPIHIQANQEVAFLQRLEGMRAAIAEKPGVTLDILPLDLSATTARSLVETTFTGSDHPTGIYAFNDEYALLLLGALARCGIRVPQEVGIIGTDNLSVGEFVWPSLTSIYFDALDIGARAVEIFHTLHQELPLPDELTRPLVPYLIPREST